MSFVSRYLNYDIYIVKKIERYYMLYHAKSSIKKYMGKFFFNRIKRINSCNIFPTIDLGANIYIAHPTNITLGETSKLGNNIMIYPGVHLVSNFASSNRSDGRRHPTIEDDCILCVNSTIVGAVTIGKNSIIAAGAIVTQDVPQNTIVLGMNQCRINKYRNREFLINLSKNSNKQRIMFYDEQIMSNDGSK